MLALARGEGQSIIIDGTIEVKIVKWSRSSVRIAIQAPREVSVDRDEIWRKMNPGVMTPLEKAEKERNERLAAQGGQPPEPGPTQIRFEDCPPAVQNTFQKETAGTSRAVTKQIRDGRLIYSATALLDGRLYTLYVGEDGGFISKELQ